MHDSSGDDSVPEASQPRPVSRGPFNHHSQRTSERTRALPPPISVLDPSVATATGAPSAGAPGASPPVQLSREQVSRAYDILEQRRFGPHLVKWGCYGSAGLIAYTYLRGFYYLSQKNRDAWMATFRHRLFIVGPAVAMYATANNVVPVPFKDKVEASLNREAITMYDIWTAKQLVRKAQSLPLSAQL